MQRTDRAGRWSGIRAPRPRWPTILGATAAAQFIALAFGLTLGTAAGTRAEAAGVTVLTYTPDRIVLGEAPYVIVRGLLVNRSGIPAQDIRVSMRLRQSPAGEILAGPGYGLSWLGTLSPGEAGPFSVAVRFCCPEDVGAYDFDVSWRGATQERYRDLVGEPHAVHVLAGLPRLYGELVNTGSAFTDASSTRVYVGFWDGSRLVDARAAVLPVFYEDGPGGAAHPPGFRMPWSTTLPEKPYDRVEVWPVADRYPAGWYPVPLGVRDVAVLPAEAGVVVTGEVYNCGTAPASDLLVMVIARDAERQVLQFDRAALTVPETLPPGAAGTIEVTWPGANSEVATSSVSLVALALDAQQERPVAVPCDGTAGRLFLPRTDR